MTTDKVSGGALVLFALLVIWECRRLPLRTFHQPGLAFVPALLALLLLVFGVSVVLAGGRAPLLSSVRWSGWPHALAILAASLPTACPVAAAMEKVRKNPVVVVNKTGAPWEREVLNTRSLSRMTHYS